MSEQNLQNHHQSQKESHKKLQPQSSLISSIPWTLEDDVNDYVKRKLESLGLKKNVDFSVESAMSLHLKDGLKGIAKTKNKSNFGKPDVHIEKYRIPVVFENKLGLKKLILKTNNEITMDEKSIDAFAVNGALHYALGMINSGKYKEVIAIGVAGNSEDDVEMQVYHVYGSSMESVNYIAKYKTLDFLENALTFNKFYKDITLTDEERHKRIIDSKKSLSRYARKLNKLMHNHNISASHRVLYVSGMILAMQDIIDSHGNKWQEGLTPIDLNGLDSEFRRDGIIITSQIEDFLKSKNIPEDKRKLMLSSFAEISKDKQRDVPIPNDKIVAKFINGHSSVNKQIFVFIYEHIFKQIDGFAGHLDIMGEMYSEFLKYALGDGKEIGIVLTPPYVTKLMVELLEINENSRVMDLATGSAGFLISAMEHMIESAENKYGKDTTAANQKIAGIKQHQLLGVELNAEMYTLAATNMILRGDGATNLQKNSAFNTESSLYTKFNANRILLNPPFSYEDNGIPFIKLGLDVMEKGGLGAIIIQDSAGSGRATKTTHQILKKHTLVASIKMPVDLFAPMAGVQTSIYIFEAGKPHDFLKPVKFIDFRKDGYKRTSRGINEVDYPTERYKDLIKIFKGGLSAKVSKELWNLNEIYVEDFINDSGADWNFEQHKVVDTTPTLADFKKTVSDYLSWEVSNILKNSDPENENLKK